jgi:FAD-dependent urate hydroxylase
VPGVAIVGAGPYGLAAAAHLAHAGVEMHCFGEPLEFWEHHMPNGMVLRSRVRSSSIADPQRALTLAHYERATGNVVNKPDIAVRQFIDYGLWFQSQAVPEVDRRRVATILREDGRFGIELVDGERLAVGAVVVAAGLTLSRAARTSLPRAHRRSCPTRVTTPTSAALAARRSL